MPQAAKNLYPIRLSGLSIGSFTGKRGNISAGQFKGRIGNTLSGLGFVGISNVNIPNISVETSDIPTNMPDLQALRAQGEQYYQQGIALVQQGKTWAANAMEEVARLDFDISQIDWGRIANQGLSTAIDSLASELSPSMQSQPIQLPDLPSWASTADFERALSNARTQTVIATTAEQVKAATLLALKKQQKIKQEVEKKDQSVIIIRMRSNQSVVRKRIAIGILAGSIVISYAIYRFRRQ